MPSLSKSNPALKKLLSGEMEIKFDFMALNLLVFNLKYKIAKNQADMDTAVEELIEFLDKNAGLPRVQSAIATLQQG